MCFPRRPDGDVCNLGFSSQPHQLVPIHQSLHKPVDRHLLHRQRRDCPGPCWLCPPKQAGSRHRGYHGPEQPRLAREQTDRADPQLHFKPHKAPGVEPGRQFIDRGLTRAALDTHKAGGADSGVQQHRHVWPDPPFPLCQGRRIGPWSELFSRWVLLEAADSFIGLWGGYIRRHSMDCSLLQHLAYI